MSSQIQLCPDCDLALQPVSITSRKRLRCPRCQRLLHKSEGSPENCLALTLTGLLLYIPANIEPVLVIHLGSQNNSNTVFSGVVELWNEQLFIVAALVFLFAMLVPLLRLLTLTLVLLPPKWVKDKGLLFMRCHHSLHGWGMMDIFLLGTLVAVIKLQDFASVDTGPGVYCLAAMMLVEMRASQLLPKARLWHSFRQVSS